MSKLVEGNFIAKLTWRDLVTRIMIWQIDWWGIFLPIWHPLETLKIVHFI